MMMIPVHIKVWRGIERVTPSFDAKASKEALLLSGWMFGMTQKVTGW